MTGPTTQQELYSNVLGSQPPAVRDVLAGKLPKPLRFGFALPTPQLLGSLTEDERSAFNTRLAYEGPGGTTLADVETAVRQRFGPTRRASRGRFLV